MTSYYMYVVVKRRQDQLPPSTMTKRLSLRSVIQSLMCTCQGLRNKEQTPQSHRNTHTHRNYQMEMAYLPPGRVLLCNNQPTPIHKLHRLMYTTSICWHE